MSVPKLELELGFSRGSMYNWDKNSPSFDKLQKVAEYFNVPTDCLIFGYNRNMFLGTLNLIKGTRTINQFAKDSGVDENEMFDLFTNNYLNLPPLEIIEKIAANNPINPLIDRNEILELAGYDPNEIVEPLMIKELSSKYQTSDTLSSGEERDIAHDLEKMLSDLANDNDIAFQGEPMDEDEREMLRISIENSLRLFKQMTKKRFNDNKK